jgi:glucokinase
MKINGRNLIGIEIGGTKLQIVLGDREGRILDRHRMAVEKSKGATGIRQEISNTLLQILKDHNPEAVGIGFGGPIDYIHGKIAISHQVEGWADFDLKTWIKDMTGLPCFVDNDANTAALAEAIKGAGAGNKRVFYVTLGSGVGGGMVCDGNIYHGAVPGESEIGQMVFDKSGMTIESQCSGWALDANIQEYIAAFPDSPLAGLTKGDTGMEARFLPQAISLGDEGAESILDQSTETLAWGLSHVVHLFHPEAIILGGGLSLMGELLRKKVSLHLKKYITKVFQPGPEIRIASLGEDVVCVGALLLAAQDLRPPNQKSR